MNFFSVLDGGRLLEALRDLLLPAAPAPNGVAFPAVEVVEVAFTFTVRSSSAGTDEWMTM